MLPTGAKSPAAFSISMLTFLAVAAVHLLEDRVEDCTEAALLGRRVLQLAVLAARPPGSPPERLEIKNMYF